MKKIKDFMLQLGLGRDESTVYLFLLKTGISSVNEISKGTGITRTSVYRICDKLDGLGFLKEEKSGKGLGYGISDLKFLDAKVKEIEKNAEELEDLHTNVKALLEGTSVFARDKIRVVYYNSEEEIKHLIWNVLNSKKKEVVGYGDKTLLWNQDWENFWKKWWEEFLERKIIDRQIINPSSTKPIVEYSKDVKKGMEGEKYSKNRVIDKDILKINFETYVYDDVYAQIQWEKDYVFGLEIYNNVVADQERELFEFFWKIAKPV